MWAWGWWSWWHCVRQWLWSHRIRGFQGGWSTERMLHKNTPLRAYDEHRGRSETLCDSRISWGYCERVRYRYLLDLLMLSEQLWWSILRHRVYRPLSVLYLSHGHDPHVSLHLYCDEHYVHDLHDPCVDHHDEYHESLYVSPFFRWVSISDTVYLEHEESSIVINSP